VVVAAHMALGYLWLMVDQCEKERLSFYTQAPQRLQGGVACAIVAIIPILE
jgi:hypothetical protein